MGQGSSSPIPSLGPPLARLVVATRLPYRLCSVSRPCRRLLWLRTCRLRMTCIRGFAYLFVHVHALLPAGSRPLDRLCGVVHVVQPIDLDR